jgi:hypothetical protein
MAAHTRLLERLKQSPALDRSSWPDYWRGFFSAYMLGNDKESAPFCDALSDLKEWQNGYHAGDRAWKLDYFSALFLDQSGRTKRRKRGKS